MPRTPKVVPIQEPKYKLIARDPEARRLILGIGSERIAVDFFSRITKLPPTRLAPFRMRAAPGTMVAPEQASPFRGPR